MAKLSIEVDMPMDDFIGKADCFIDKIQQMTKAVQSLNESCKIAGISLKSQQDMEVK